MAEKIVTIIISVSLFGIIFFLYIKSILKKNLKYYLSKNKKK